MLNISEVDRYEVIVYEIEGKDCVDDEVNSFIESRHKQKTGKRELFSDSYLVEGGIRLKFVCDF
jgi:hypothetical protein